MSRDYRFMPADTPDYSGTAAGRGWGPGWPTDRSGSMASFSVPTRMVGNQAGTGKWAEAGHQDFQVHHLIADMLHLILTHVQASGYPLVAGWCWSYENRAIGGTSSPSNHSWGLAVDLNAPDNPFTFPRVTDFPPWLPDLFARYGFAWGGDYTGATDSMHVEFLGTTTDAVNATTATRAELGGPPPKPPPPPPDPFLEMIMQFYATKAEFEAMLTAKIEHAVHAVLASDSDVGAAAFGPNFQAGVHSGVDQSLTASAVKAIRAKLGA